MRLAYFGTGSFAVPALERMAPWIVLVVSQPDRPSGRGLKLHSSPVKARALELGLPVETPEKSRHPEFVQRVKDLALDALLVASYGQILSVSLLEAARCGGLNLHGSILPAYRGAAPIQRAILDGQAETGVTLMQMDRGMDTGAMHAIVRTPIGPDETYGELQDRLAILAADLAEARVSSLVRGEGNPEPQNDALATLAPKIERAETRLDPARSALEEYRRFRALTPAPGVWLSTRYGRLKVKDARSSALQGVPGTLLAIAPEPVLAFQGGSLELRVVQPEGRPAVAGRDFVNGARLRLGDPLCDLAGSEL